MDPVDPLLLDCIVFVACGTGGLILGVVFAHAIPRRCVAQLWPAEPSPIPWRNFLPEPPHADEHAARWPPAKLPDDGGGVAPLLGLLLGGFVLVGLLGALSAAARREPKP